MARRLIYAAIAVLTIVIVYMALTRYYSMKRIDIYIYYSGKTDSKSLVLSCSDLRINTISRGAVIKSTVDHSYETAVNIKYISINGPIEVQAGYVGPEYTGEMHIVIDENGMACIRDTTKP